MTYIFSSLLFIPIMSLIQIVAVQPRHCMMLGKPEILRTAPNQGKKEITFLKKRKFNLSHSKINKIILLTHSLCQRMTIRADRNLPVYVDLNIFSVYYSLGSGSDMATFYQRAGVPSIDMWFTYDEVSSEGRGGGLHAQWWLYTGNLESIRYFELIN